MLEALLFWLVVGFVLAAVAAVVIYFVARWLFILTAERMALIVDRQVGAAAAHAFTRLARYAQATGIPLEEATRFFDKYIDRLAWLMDSAVKIPILGRVGLDAVLDLIPVVGNLAGTGLGLTLVARTLRYGPPPSLVSKMLSNVLVDLLLGSIPIVGFFADIWFKANERNVKLMRQFLQSRPE